MNTDSEIVKFFDQQSVFITGGTGFLGKLTVEKLLRVTNVKKIYLLIRAKKGKSVNDRFDELFDNEVFDLMKKNNENYKSIVKLVDGDCIKSDLGLSQEDQNELISNVTCIIHIAATVRFNEPLRTATYINVRATRDLLKMAEQMQNLKVFLHMSTAYCHCSRTQLEEIIYDTHITGQAVIELVELLDDNLLQEITPTLLRSLPNTYVFTKSLAEQLLLTQSGRFPIAVLRPGPVTSTAHEPISGWIDNMYGPVSMIVGVAVGLLRVICVNKNAKPNWIPADYVVNTTLAAAQNSATSFSKLFANSNNKIDEKIMQEPSVYMAVAEASNPVQIEKMTEIMKSNAISCATARSIWWPFLIRVSNIYLFYIAAFFLHKIPGYIFDAGLIIAGKKPLLTKAYKKIHKHMAATRYFMTREFVFSDKNTRNLWKSLSDIDKNLFPFDVKAIDWNEYVKDTFLGGRVYLLKDPLSTLPQARRKAKIFRALHYTLIGILYVLAVTICWSLLGFIWKILMAHYFTGTSTSPVLPFNLVIQSSCKDSI